MATKKPKVKIGPPKGLNFLAKKDVVLMKRIYFIPGMRDIDGKKNAGFQVLPCLLKEFPSRASDPYTEKRVTVVFSFSNGEYEAKVLWNQVFEKARDAVKFGLTISKARLKQLYRLSSQDKTNTVIFGEMENELATYPFGRIDLVVVGIKTPISEGESNWIYAFPSVSRRLTHTIFLTHTIILVI